MDIDQREIPSEIEARIRRSAPRLPPELRSRTLAACARPASPPATPLAATPAATAPAAARFEEAPRRRGFTLKPRNRRMMLALAGGLCLAQIIAVSLMQPVHVVTGPDGRLQPDSRNTADAIRFAFQTRVSELTQFFSNSSR